MGDPIASLKGLRARFFVLDDPDGAGESTVIRRVATEIGGAGLRVVTCRDPGGTTIGDRIRGVLLDHDLSGMDIGCETLLFMASRAQLVAEVVKPALAEGKVVLCDRFVSATCAYQVAAGALLQDILDLARHAIGNCWPDLTIILDTPADVGFERIARHRRATSGASDAGSNPIDPAEASSPSGLDRMERRPRDFHNRVRDHFLSLSGSYPAPMVVVDAAQPLEAVVASVLDHLVELGGRTGSDL